MTETWIEAYHARLTKLKETSRNQLENILHYKLGSHQFTIQEVKDGWNVEIGYVPRGLKIPEEIHYWKVHLSVKKPKY